MSKPFTNASELRRSKGFTLVELMVAMALSLLLLGIAMTLFDQLNNVAALAASAADVNQNLRAAADIISRDLSTTGGSIPLGGIPLPGGGSATAILRPGPPTCAPCNFSAYPNMNVITPGTSLGPPAGGDRTDEITMISANPWSSLNTCTLTSVSYTTTSASITVPTAVSGSCAVPPNLGAGSASQVLPGQLIMLTNANGSCLLTATAVNAATGVITFTYNDANDVLGLNQFPGGATNPTLGTIAQLETGGVFPPTTAYPITMISYYLSNTNPPSLMRQVGTGILNGAAVPSQAVAREINLLEFSYNLSDGVTFDQTIVTSPNLIRQVNMSVTAISTTRNRKTGQYYSNGINTAATVQNLAFYNKF